VITLRSLIFNVAFYLNTLLFLVVSLPAFLLTQRSMVQVAQWWGAVNLWLLRVICNLKFELRGRDNIPAGGFLVASKHQSAWETFALFPVFEFPAVVLKRELTWIPVFGWGLIKAGMIALDRDAGKEALKGLIEKVRATLAQDREVIVFPEGTRRPPGAPPDYKLGIVQIYSNCNVACLPVALNSGMFWQRRGFMRYPGTVVVEVLPPIPAGLPRAAFYRRLQDELEAATQRLIAETANVRTGASASQNAAQAPQFKDL
jgi:1-acyl-sn-glycerol-3-phosphate acyltransferase